MEPEVYKVQTEFFEGPLDLLLHLIRKNKMNILDVRISDITSEYLSYLKDKRGINPSREGDFLITASTLIYLKSRSLLPRSDMEMEGSPEKEFIDTLIEYDKIQKISRVLKGMEEEELLLWKREEVFENFENREFDLEEVSSFQLAEVFLNIVKKKDMEEFLYIQSKNFTVEDKIKEILQLLDSNEYLNFTEYLENLDSVEEMIICFFALLEMIKKRMIIAVQKFLFDKISVWKNNREESVQ